MHKVDFIGVDDLSIIRTKHQCVGILGYKISDKIFKQIKLDEFALLHFLNSFNLPYSLKFNRNEILCLFLFNENKLDSLFNTVAQFKVKKKKLLQKSIQSTILKYNTTQHMSDMQQLYQSQIKRTENQRIFKIGSNYYCFISIKPTAKIDSNFLKFIQEVIHNQINTYLTINSLVSDNVSKQRVYELNLTFRSSSIEEIEKDLKLFDRNIEHHKNTISCILRFHSFKDIKTSLLNFIFGISNIYRLKEHYIEQLNLGHLIPRKQINHYLENNMLNKTSKKATDFITDITNSTSRDNSKHLKKEKTNTEMNFFKNQASECKSSNRFNKNNDLVNISDIEVEFTSKKEEIKKDNKKSKEKKSLYNYGKKIPETQIRELIDTIPNPTK